MQQSNRPLSPHLLIYRPQLTSVLSITHRGTGALLAVASVLLVYWLWAIDSGLDAFNTAQAFFGSWFGLLLLFGCTFALLYHLCNGIRHLFWDAGMGLDLDATYRSGRIVVVVSGGLTVLAWILGLAMGTGT